MFLSETTSLLFEAGVMSAYTVGSHLWNCTGYVVVCCFCFLQSYNLNYSICLCISMFDKVLLLERTGKSVYLNIICC